MIRTCLLTDSCCRKGKKRVVSLCALDIAVLFRCQRYDFFSGPMKDIFLPEKEAPDCSGAKEAVLFSVKNETYLLNAST